MSNRYKLADIEIAMIALGKSGIPAIYGTAVDVDGISASSFDDDGNLILRSPMVRLRLQDPTYEPTETQRTTYKAETPFIALCFCENLRSGQEERSDTLRLLDAVQECFAGAKLTLATGATTGPIALGGVYAMKNEDQVIDGFFGVQFSVPTHPQFSGANAHFGGSHA